MSEISTDILVAWSSIHSLLIWGAAPLRRPREQEHDDSSTRSNLLVEARFQALAIIAQQHTNPSLNASTIAHQIAISRRHLDRAFTNGASVSACIARCRLATALALMHSGQSLDAVARRAGFRNRNTFRDQFIEQFGIPPSRARELTSALAEKLERSTIC